ncbi:MAG: hypothetical protein IT342_01350 [Candidatus Melainabacteria bacterium]|nr:hypothetical protein [Candidatus Melainabacteria bacterium]
MSLSSFDLLLSAIAITAIMMLGTTNIGTNLRLYALHSLLIAAATAWLGQTRHEPALFLVAAIFALVKAGFVPWFLNSIIRQVGGHSDSGAFIPTALSMPVGIALLGANNVLAQRLPTVINGDGGNIGETFALSLITTGMLLMLTRNIAVNQVIGFLVIENGIYLFSQTQTQGMPMALEMGILLDLLVAVMIAGILLFRIKKNFEHIDISKLTELKD